LLTAEFAAEMGREVMAVPGRVTSAESRGAHRLIQDGAALVQDAGDVIGLLPGPWQACVRPGGDRPAEPGGDGPGPASPEEDRVLEALGEEPVGVDEVIERTGMAPGRAVAALLALELRGQARQLGGKRFVRA
jgi:DNA processing protein